MLKPLICCVTVILALCSCTKKDDAAPESAQTPPTNAMKSAEDAAPRSAGEPAPGPALSEAETEPTDKQAATSIEAERNKEKKQRANTAGASAKAKRSVVSRRWHEFQTMVDRCVTALEAEREQCLADAKDTYRSANFECDALPTQERRNCLQFAERWNMAAEDAPTTAIKHDKEPMITAPSPGDSRPAERNRDSTKQQQDAVGTIPEPTRPN
jgi:hypothetical protein